MKKALFMSMTLLIFTVVAGYSDAENKGEKLIPVKSPASQQTPSAEQNIDSGLNYDTQYAAPAPRDQLYVFWLLGRVISYPIDKLESYISGKFNSVKQPKPIPAAAPGQVSGPFDSLHRREIPPAPPVDQKNNRNR